MPDVLTKTQRSYNMSKIKAKNTKAEIILRRSLYKQGAKSYRIHYNIEGKPDIAFPKKKIAIFVDGCFWHRCPLHFVEPETRADFWLKKIESNVKRDRVVDDKLRKDGWQVIRFWEHEIIENPADTTFKIIGVLNGC